jgi:D-citramalate synthase
MPEIKINVKESSLYTVSKLVETFTGYRIPANKPIVGDNVFTKPQEYMQMVTQK